MVSESVFFIFFYLFLVKICRSKIAHKTIENNNLDVN